MLNVHFDAFIKNMFDIAVLTSRNQAGVETLFAIQLPSSSLGLFGRRQSM
jgi:hypothetical protein